MVFKRRDRRPVLRMIGDFVYPKGGWVRAATYVKHRLRRLPDPPHRIARGIFAGIFISFTPFFGGHFIGAGLLAWALRGNILAALLATFVGNPLTTPFIALVAVGLGRWMLGYHGDVALPQVFQAFSRAWLDVWNNLQAVFTDAPTGWARLSDFYAAIFLPYMVGGIIPGIFVGMAGYYLSLPVVKAYQRRRDKKRREQLDKRIAVRAAAAEKARAAAAEAAEGLGVTGDGVGHAAPKGQGNVG